jgi:acetolactate synthase-1/2/3 large subunit
MSETGAQLVRYALEQLKIKHIFTVLGNHNREIYDELNRSTSINTHLLNQEISAVFMADAISRSAADIEVGTVLITADAIISQGIADAFISGIPLLVITGGPVANELTVGIDPLQLLQPVTKACFKVTEFNEIVSSIFEAQLMAISDKPGPVAVQIPINLQVHKDDLEEPLPVHLSAANQPQANQDQLEICAQKLMDAENPCLFLGWGAARHQKQLVATADFLAAPVCTSLQGNSAFPAEHPLHAGLITNPSAGHALKDCDVLISIGVNDHDLKYVELPKQVIPLEPEAIPDLLHRLQAIGNTAIDSKVAPKAKIIIQQISKDKAELKEDWLEHNSRGRVNPAVFFAALSKALNNDAIVVAGYGSHGALAAELLPIKTDQGFISPSSFNTMGYCVPAVNAIKLANPKKQVVGIVGDGAMIISGMEVITAVREQLGTVYCLFNNDERTANKSLGHINWGSFADALECGYFLIANNHDIDIIMRRALETAAHGQPVIVEISIDYSRRTHYTQRIEKAQQASLPSSDKLGRVKRAIVRKIMGSK